MQETKLADDAFPRWRSRRSGYEAAHHGQGQWNGVAILSRVGLDDVVVDFADGAEPDAEARLITATCGGIRVVSVYVPNGRALDADHYQYKLRWLDRLGAHLDAVAAPTATPVVVAGDFNIAPTDVDVYDPAKFVGATHVSEPERERARRARSTGASPTCSGTQHPDARAVYSWWDYRARRLPRGPRHAHRPRAGSASVAERVEWVRHRPQRPQGQAAERPRPRRRRPRD